MDLRSAGFLAVMVLAAGACSSSGAKSDATGGGNDAAAGTSGSAGAGPAGAGGAGTSGAAGTGATAGTSGAAGTGATAGTGPAGATGAAGETTDARVDTGAAAMDVAKEAAPGEVAPGCTPCADYGTPAPAGRVTAAALDQLSGIAASRRNPGVLFVHNDRNMPELWAVSESGTLLATFTYTGATVRDVEDIAVSPCPTGTCIFLADIGGNLAARPDYTIVRFPEPAVATNGSAAPVSIAADKLVFTYPDGALHNAETLLIDPRSGTPYVVDKVAAGMRSTAYRLSATFGGATIVATKIGELPVPAAGDMPATSGDAHPCGTGFILATGNTAYEFRIPATSPFEDAFKATPVTVPAATEQQREGIAYAPDGRGYFTNSEGSMQPINRVSCK